MPVKRCPRCGSTMVADIESNPGSDRRIWKCIGCGREVLQNDTDQAEEDRLVERISRYERPTYQR